MWKHRASRRRIVERADEQRSLLERESAAGADRRPGRRPAASRPCSLPRGRRPCPRTGGARPRASRRGGRARPRCPGHPTVGARRGRARRRIADTRRASTVARGRRRQRGSARVLPSSPPAYFGVRRRRWPSPSTPAKRGVHDGDLPGLIGRRQRRRRRGRRRQPAAGTGLPASPTASRRSAGRFVVGDWRLAVQPWPPTIPHRRMQLPYCGCDCWVHGLTANGVGATPRNRPA